MKQVILLLGWFLFTALVFFLAGAYLTYTHSKPILMECPTRIDYFKTCLEDCKVNKEEWCYWQCGKILSETKANLL